MTTNSIEVYQLKKSYGKNDVLHGISFEVKQGEIFGFLGVNGAGKTTTLSCIEGIVNYTQGDIKINGKVGVQLQVSSLPANIKCLEAIHFFAKWQKAKVDTNLIDRLGINEFKKNQYKDCSTGQKRRLHLAIALIGNPDIVILDEPTAGLDVEGRYALHEEIRSLKKQGKTILLASHDMAEVEELCDRIAILKDGEIAFMGNPQELSKVVQKSTNMQIRFNGEFDMNNIHKSKYCDMNNKYYVFQTEDLTDAILEIGMLAKNQSKHIQDIKIDVPTLEQQFMAIAKEKSV
ncbi:MAG: ABC transporter ATP-binding protein [Anaerorhabdus sp.]|uniref:ABC transporter ATP-binding protein n=1 Tax=Anaerorhabdus sp. TaxID=1872524 RepID=UPI002FCBB1EF